jgi:MFS transporter, ACS family, pantothenate transporter
MALWLKAEKTYTVPQINNLPTVYSAISIVYMLGSGVYNDWSGTRMPSLILIGVCNIVAESILVARFAQRVPSILHTGSLEPSKL